MSDAEERGAVRSGRHAVDRDRRRAPAGELVGQSMVTTGAITNRIDRLEERSLVERRTAADRRKVIVRLTSLGSQLVDEVAESHMAVERELLGPLTERQQQECARLPRVLLLGLDDTG